eukprot:1520473-Pyramimonas_sp.AAC.1
MPLVFFTFSRALRLTRLTTLDRCFPPEGPPPDPLLGSEAYGRLDFTDKSPPDPLLTPSRPGILHF